MLIHYKEELFFKMKFFLNTTNQFLKRQKISLQNDQNYYLIEIYLHHQIFFLYKMKSNFLHDEKILIV